LFFWDARATSRNFCARLFNKKKNNNNNNGYEFQKEGTQVNDLSTGLACDQAVLDASKLPGD